VRVIAAPALAVLVGAAAATAVAAAAVVVAVVAAAAAVLTLARISKTALGTNVTGIHSRWMTTRL